MQSKPIDIPCDGRRIVHLKTLARDLWCSECDKSLSLRNVVDERIFGLASLLKVKCLDCSTICMVKTDNDRVSVTTNRNKTKKEFPVNIKLAIGIYIVLLLD